jgi:hypothetical protein
VGLSTSERRESPKRGGDSLLTTSSTSRRGASTGRYCWLGLKNCSPGGRAGVRPSLMLHPVFADSRARGAPCRTPRLPMQSRFGRSDPEPRWADRERGRWRSECRQRNRAPPSSWTTKAISGQWKPDGRDWETGDVPPPWSGRSPFPTNPVTDERGRRLASCRAIALATKDRGGSPRQTPARRSIGLRCGQPPE